MDSSPTTLMSNPLIPTSPNLDRQAASRPRAIDSLGRILTKKRSVPTRRFMLFSAVSAILAMLILLTGMLQPQPHFRLGNDQAHLDRIGYHPLRRASDWLRGHKYALLTFDDGPAGNGVDERILGILRRHHAHAMFFLICNNIDEETNGVLGQIEREGHVIGNHSFDHPKLPKVSLIDLPHQIEDCSQQIAKLTGHRPRYFRPPFGMTSKNVGALAKESGMKQMLWDANSYDVLFKKPEDILHHSLVEADDTSIILMHERAITASALEQILTELEHEGFSFVLPDDSIDESIQG